ncbi:MAG: tyrosine-type recombinase/integrase [Kitasatospora sp.]|nr:tyrosine-type recombinase/integrase [Kitasatospora sp.]
MRAHLDWLALRGHTPASVYARERALTRLLAALPCDTLTGATPDMLTAWRAGLQVTDSTVVHYAKHARNFYAWALTEGLVEVNPAAGLPLPRLGRRLPRPAAEADLMTALAAAPPRIRPWLVLAGWAGLRAREIALLRRENVLDTATPPVLLIAADATKGHHERAVPMHPLVLAELHAAGLPRAGWVFPRHDGQPGPNAPHMISHLANDHLHACGSPATLHQLRHRFGTQTYQASRDLRAVQELLGHASPSTTAGYAAYDQPGAIAAVAALPAPGRLTPVPSIAAG